jgi:hypothetical protein
VDNDLVSEAEQRRPPNLHDRYQSKPWNSNQNDHQVTMVANGANGDGLGRATLLQQDRFSMTTDKGKMIAKNLTCVLSEDILVFVEDLIFAAILEC